MLLSPRLLDSLKAAKPTPMNKTISSRVPRWKRKRLMAWSLTVLTVTDFGGIYRRPHVPSKIRWPQVLFQKQVIAKSLFLDLLTREAGKASHMTVNLSKEPLFEGQTGLSPQNP